MYSVKLAIIVLVLPYSVSSVEWGGLRVGFGIHPDHSNLFSRLPRTVAEAERFGWVLEESEGGCDQNDTWFKGNRYIQGEDSGAMPLFDVNGYIAGVQTAIPKKPGIHYPELQSERYNIFNEEDKVWVITVYFVEPDDICSKGRSQTEFERDGTGNMLAFQVGPTSDNLARIPLDESDIVPSTDYVKGKCVDGMGTNYWYNVTRMMRCKELFPPFLMYSDGRLTGFGWLFLPTYDTSYWWEHVWHDTFYSLMKPVPRCLAKDHAASVVHFYLKEKPWEYKCPKKGWLFSS